MLHLDLFSGIGGFALAAKWSDFKTIAFVEKDIFCQKVLKKHWPNVLIHGDIKTFKGPQDVDLLTAGFPCQPFSVAGKQKGIKDERYLWPDTIRIIRESRPTWCILENVPGIISHLDPILEDLEREGYTWRAYLIPASALNAPHKRERLWIIAYANGERCDYWLYYRKKRHLQENWERYTKKVQQEWAQFIPKSWQTFNAQEWFTCNTNSEKWNSWERLAGKHRGNSEKLDWQEDQPPVPGVDDGIPNWLDRNKSLGNAIVPQIAYALMQILKECEP